MRRSAPLVCLLLIAIPAPAYAVFGGTDSTNDAVVAVVYGTPDVSGSRSCSGVLVGQRTVLTSAACAHHVQATQATAQVVFASSVFGAPSVAVAGVRIHRHDPLAVLYLAQDAPVAPAGLNTLDLGFFDVGVEAIGFGGTGTINTAGSRNLAGQTYRPSGSQLLVEVDGGICIGDSGAPLIDDNAQVAGIVTDEITNGGRCSFGATALRVDAYLDTFIYPAIDAAEGPCRADGVCVRAGCRTPDPDCPENVCGFQGVCERACPEPDWDCPIGGGLGDECLSAYDCENRLCVPTVDQPGLSLCTVLCDRTLIVPCPHLMTCSTESGPGICVFEAPSPRTQGHTCTADDQCRAHMCDVIVQTCVEPCDAYAGNVCPDGLVCRHSSYGRDVCLPRLEPHGICGVAPGSSAGDPPWLLVAGLAIWVTIRRLARGWRVVQ